MMAHWQNAHKTMTMPAELSEQLKIRLKEKSGKALLSRKKQWR
jgi:hypothetical protein